MITGSARGTGERLPQTVARAAARAPRIAVITAAESSPRVSMSLLIVGSEATAPNNSGWARMTAASATQSPPSAIVTARFSTVLPGSCTDRAGRHGLNACESSLASPLTWADFSNSAAPADEINDSPPDSTPTPPQRLGFTYGVPFSYPENGPSTSPLDLRQAHFPLLDRHFRASLAEQSHHHRLNHERSRLALWGCMLQRQPAYVRLGEDPLAVVGVGVRRPGVRGTACRTRPRAGIDTDVVGAEQITAPGALDPGLLRLGGLSALRPHPR